MVRKKTKRKSEKKKRVQTNRKLSTFENSYLEELNKYRKLLKTTLFISLNQGGIDTSGRGVRASKIFTRQALVGLSFERVLPSPSLKYLTDHELWDVSSIAILSRSLMEGCLALYYFGIEVISEDEAELRFLVGQLHKNIEYHHIRKEELIAKGSWDELKNIISKQKLRIKNHPYLSSLTQTQRQKVKSRHEMYKTKADFEKELPFCKDLRIRYRHLSNLAHPLPLSIEPRDNVHGRGIGSDVDVSYCIACLMLGRKYLAASTVGFADFFEEKYHSNKYQRMIDEARPLVNEGFD